MSANQIRPTQKLRQVFARNWPATEATIESCSWVRDSDYTGVEAGHYEVAVSYNPPDPVHAGEICQGQFRRSGSRQIAPYRTGEQLPIRYNLKNPRRFRLAGASHDYEKLETILVMSLFALLAGYLLFIF